MLDQTLFLLLFLVLVLPLPSSVEPAQEVDSTHLINLDQW